MNLTQLIESFESLTGQEDEIDTEVFVVWANEAQDKISMEYGPMVEIDLGEKVSGDLYTLPTNFLKLENVFKDTEEYSGTLRKKLNQYLVIPEDGEWVLEYVRMSAPLTTADIEQEPELHMLLHPLIPLYCAYKYHKMQSEGDPEELNLANSYLEEFTFSLLEKALYLRTLWDGRSKGANNTEDTIGWRRGR